MKNIIHLIALWAFIFSFSTLTAQEAQETKKIRKPLQGELGLNVSSLFDRLTRKSSDSSAVNPYLIQCRLGLGKFGLKIAGGGQYNKARSSERGFLDSNTALNEQFDFRAGFDYRQDLGRRFSASCALEGLWGYAKAERITDSGFDVERRITQKEYWGVGPTLGLHFWMNRHLALYTEMGLYAQFGVEEEGRFFKNFPELNDNVRDVETTEFKPLLPTRLYLIYRF